MAFFSRQGKYLFPLVWLVYLAFPITDILSRHAAERILGFLVLALFVAAYLLSWWDSKRLLYYVGTELIIVAYFTLLWESSYLYLVFFITPAVAFLPNPKMFRTFTTVLILLLGGFFAYASSFLTEGELLNLVPAMIVAIVVPIGVRGGLRSRELKGQLNLAQEEIARLSKQEERQRISRNLHDTLGHTLSLIALKSELVEKLVDKQPERAVLEAKDIRITARAALKQVRELVSDMSSVTVTGEISHAKRILAAAGITLEVNVNGHTPGKNGEDSDHGLEPFAQNVLGMCLRETITNVVKHSRATRCEVSLAGQPHAFTLTVSDNGVGAGQEGLWTRGTGLNGIKERISLLNGSMDLSAGPGKGTRVQLTVPRIVRNLNTGGGTP